jgi:hypothetical protein
MEGGISGRRRRWVKAKVEASMRARRSVEELSEVSNGAGSRIMEPVCSDVTGALDK